MFVQYANAYMYYNMYTLCIHVHANMLVTYVMVWGDMVCYDMTHMVCYGMVWYATAC